MSKSLPLEAVKTMLKPVMHLIGKKADKDELPDVSGYIKSVNGTTADENGNVDVTGLPEGASAYQQMVTDGEGNTKWEDRTHYVSTEMRVMLPVTTIALSGYGDMPIYAGELGVDVITNAALGDVFIVRVNGVEYQTEARQAVSGGELAIGNIGLFGAAEDTGEPFCIMSTGIIIASNEAITSADVGISCLVKNFKTIDPKYLPEEKRYALTETITLAEAINSKTLTFTEDADSYQLAFSCPAAEAALGLSVEVYTADGLVAYMWMAGMIDTTVKYAKCSMYRAHGEWVFESMQPVNNENQTSAVSRNPKFVSAEKPITKIVVYASSGGMMPAGTTIEVRSF